MTANAHGNLSGKHLVVFGCGYVGSEVALQALAGGAQVTALTRNEAKASVLRAAGATTIVADLASLDWHGQIAGSADFVLNCVSSGGVGLEGYRHSYVAGMESLLTWARTRGAAGTIVPRNNWVGNPIRRLDMRLQKHVKIGDRASVDGMLELFNVFDHANYGSYTTQESSASYGMPSFNANVSYGPRALQLGFRVQF